MGIPESQLETWSHQGSIKQSADTYEVVKRALEVPTSKYASKDFSVFLQGSYGNDTNIYAESDVDVVIRLDSTYFYDTSQLSPQQLQLFQASFSPATYMYNDYKTDVIEALKKCFGTDVIPGEKPIKIKANGTRRSADVIVATQFRDYYSGPFGPAYDVGICFFTSGGKQIVNYPRQHSANCTTKHQSTGQRFKPMVRVLKNMRSRLVADKVISGGIAPSYFLEGLLYNVPVDNFRDTYGGTFVEAINWVVKTDRTKLVCANEKHWLSRDYAPECWPCASCEGFIGAAIKLWNDWK